MTSSDGPGATAAACATCGAQASVGEVFCRRCGSPLPGALPPPSVPAASTAVPRASPESVTTRAIDLDAVAQHATAAAVPAATTHIAPVSRFDQPTPRALDVVPCPACPTLNVRGRELCAGCGVDLETGEELPQPRPGPGNGVPSVSRLPARAHRAWWVAPVAIVGVAAAILAGLWAADIGPFASEPELPAAEFAPERYPVDDDPEHLVLSDIATLTTRAPEGPRTFPVEQMVDTDPETAWHSNPSDLPEGVDEKVDLFLGEPAWIAQLIINNGDHADATAYAATGRIQRAELVMDGDVRVEIVLLDLGREPQAVSLPEPILTTTVRLEILEVLPGTDSASLAISDLELRGWPADPADADLALQRADLHQAAGSFTLPD